MKNYKYCMWTVSNEIRKYSNILNENAINIPHLPFKTVNFTVDGKSYAIVGWSNRAFVVIDINGVGIPFYLSSGEGGKANVKSGRWYPFFGVGSDGWLNKGTEDVIIKYYLSKTLETISNQLDSLVGDIRSEIKDLPAANYHIISDVANRDVDAVPYGNPSAAWNNINQTLVKINSDPLLIPYLNDQLLLLKINKIDQAKFDKNIDLLLQNHSRKKNLILAYLQKNHVDIGKFTNQPIVASDEQVFETWSKKYKRSINCSNPKGFSQKAHCAARKKRRAGGKTKSKPVRETLLRTELLLEEIVDTLRSNGWSMLAIEDHLLARLDAKQILDENLRKWFKQKWVRFGPDGKIRGECARGSKSEGKPKCLPQAKAHALGKKGRASAANRKRRQDPNPERRGKAKNVATKKQSMAEGANESLSSMAAQDQAERNEYRNFVKSQAGGDWTKGARMYAQLKHRPRDDIFGDKARLNKFMMMKFDFEKFADSDWDNYWLLAQHCDWDRNFQKQALDIIKKYQGTDHSNYKYLYDRIRVGLTGKQKYGTQNGAHTTNGKQDVAPAVKRDMKQGVAEGVGLDQEAGIGIDGKSFKFKIRDLVAFADKYPVTEIDPQQFADQLEGRDEDPTQSMARAEKADLKYPIIVVKRKNGQLWIADGTHRVHKAILNKLSRIKAKIIPIKDMVPFDVEQGMAEKITPTTIHDLADKKGIKWDNAPNFLNMTKRLTGKKHLDDLTQQELARVFNHLQKQPGRG